MNRYFKHHLLAALLCVAFTTGLHAQLPNAWRITDNSAAGGSALNYTTNLPAALQTAVNTGGFRYSATLRVLTNHPGSKTMALGYGLGSERFLVWLDLDSNGDLTAELEGGQTYTLTTNGTGAASYHTHEIIYTGAVATYLVDGQLFTTTWAGSGNSLPAAQVFWGAGSSPGTGAMSIHQIAFQVPDVGVVAQYDAGTNGNPIVAPDPLTLGWTNNIPPTNAAPVSPDAVALPTEPVVTTLPGTALTPHQARLEGALNTGGQMSTVWFEWGTDTSYGNTTPQIMLKGDTNDVFIAQNITGLAAGATYHYRLIVYTSQGATQGQDVAFTTSPTFVVTTLADGGPGSLRQAIADAISGDIINIETNGTLTLTSSQLVITNDLTITGPGPSQLAISGNNARRIFVIGSDATTSISGLTLSNGRAPNGANSGTKGVAGGNGLAGGGIHNSGTLVLSNCVITANAAGNGGNGFQPDTGGGSNGGSGGNGGGIYNAGTLTLLSCIVSTNAPGNGGNGGRGADGFTGSPDGAAGGAGGRGGDGGGIYSGGTITMNACTLNNNGDNVGLRVGNGGNGGVGGDAAFLSCGNGGPGGAGGRGCVGGGLYIADTATLTGCTLARNGGYPIFVGGGGGSGGSGGRSGSLGGSNGSTGSAGADRSGGGIYNTGTTTINNSTFFGNYAGTDIFHASASSALTLNNCTVGRIYNNGGTTLSLTNTIVRPGDLGSYSGANNLITDDIPVLAPLGHYGGSTQTMPPLAGSPAIDAGSDFVTNSLATDQRGYPRLSGAQVDIGAVEAQQAPGSNPPFPVNFTVGSGGAPGFSFTNVSNADFSVLASTNVALPLSQWTVLGPAQQNAPGEYLFIDPAATNHTHRFYRAVSP